MPHGSIRWLSWIALLLSILLWGGFMGMSWLLQGERQSLAAALAERAEYSVREESQTRLRAAVRDTESERLALESALAMPIVSAVELIEAAGRSAGVKSIAIIEANPQTTATKELSNVSVMVQANGTFAALMRSVSLFETLPLVTSVEQIQLERLKDTWQLVVRMRVLLASETL